MTVISYAFEEAWASLRRAGRSAVISIGTIAIAFLTLGAFLLVSVNVQRVLDRWLAAAELSVYLRDDVSVETRSEIEAKLRGQSSVANVEYVSKERALERFRSDFPELSDVAGSSAENPFPQAFEVRLHERDATGAAENLAADLEGQDGVADVRYDRDWLERLLAIITTARVIAAVVAGVLMIGAAFTVAAVVRLSLHVRRDELEIMQLVGAPFSYIRGPSIFEGMLLGGIGAAVAFVGTGLVFFALERSLGTDIAGLVGTGEVRFLGFREALLMLFGGVAVGAIAGTLASRAAN